MRVPLQFLIVSGVLVGCGGDEQPNSTTTTTPTVGTSSDTVTSGSGVAEESSDTTPTTSAPAPGAPVFLSFQSNVSKITAGESVIFTAILTDPDGVNDIVGGALSDESGMIGYGPFVAAGQEGTYSISLSWDAVHQADPIEFEGMDLTRVFRAEFYDQGANKVSKDVNLVLTCVEKSACAGVCTDIMTNADHCGACSSICEGGCDAGKCAPKWGECIQMNSGFDTCDTYCTSVQEACVQDGCQDGSTVRVFGGNKDCKEETLYTTVSESCDTVQTWSIGRLVVQCCCTDTK